MCAMTLKGYVSMQATPLDQQAAEATYCDSTAAAASFYICCCWHELTRSFTAVLFYLRTLDSLILAGATRVWAEVVELRANVL